MKKITLLDYVNICIILILIIFTYGFFAGYHIDLHHDGVMLAGISALHDGRALYKDEFQFYGILGTYFNYGIFEITGNNLLNIRYIYVFIYAYIYILLYLIMNTLKINRIITIANIFLLFSYTHFFYSASVFYLSIWPNVLCIALILSCVFTNLILKLKYQGFYTFLFIITTLLVKINYGIIFLIANFLGFIIFYKSNRIKINLIISLIVSSSIIILLYYFNFPFKFFISQNIIAPLLFTSANKFSQDNSTFINIINALLRRGGHGGVDLALHLIPFFNLVALKLFWNRYSSESKIPILIGVSSWLLYYPIPSLQHIFNALPLLLIPFAINIQIIINHSHSIKYKNILKILIISMLLFLCYRFSVSIYHMCIKISEYIDSYEINNDIKLFYRIKIDSITSKNLSEFSQNLNNRSEEKFINLSSSSIYSIIANKLGKNIYILAPYNYLWDWGFITNSNYYKKLNSELYKNDFKYIILSPVPFPIKGYRISEIYNSAFSKKWARIQDFPQELYLNVPNDRQQKNIKIKTSIISNDEMDTYKYINTCGNYKCIMQIEFPVFIEPSQIYISIQDALSISNHKFNRNEKDILNADCPNLDSNLFSIDYFEYNFNSQYFHDCLTNSFLFKRGKIYYSYLNHGKKSSPMNSIKGNLEDIQFDKKIFAVSIKNNPIEISNIKSLNRLYIIIPREFKSISGKILMSDEETDYHADFILK